MIQRISNIPVEQEMTY